MEQLSTNILGQTKGKPDKVLLEPMNLKRAIFKHWSDALFINLD